jgi:hypothetical protein
VVATLLMLTVPSAAMPSLALASSVGVYAFAAPKVTPDDAARKRAEAQVTGRQLVEADPSAAGVHYDTTASEWGDPVLYLDAADAYYKAAEQDSEVALAEAGIERARIALDLLFFQLDAAADKSFRLVDTADIPDLITRANTAVKTGEELVAKLRGLADGAVATTDVPKKKEKRPRKPINGRALYISGAVVTGLGAAVLGLGAVGLILGGVRQNQAEDPKVYGSDYDEVARKGHSANVMAGVGFGLGGALAVGGVVMMIIGKHAQKKAKPMESTAALRQARKSSLRFSPGLNGGAISGRF